MKPLLYRMGTEGGGGLILVTHRLGDIAPEIGRVVLMRAGLKAELLTEASLSRLFGRR